MYSSIGLWALANVASYRSGMANHHSSAQGPAQYWQNESWDTAGGGGTTMNGLANMGMAPEGRFHIIHGLLARWIKWRACDVGQAKGGLENELWLGKATEGLENELWLGKATEGLKNDLWALLILQPFRHFTYRTGRCPAMSWTHWLGFWKNRSRNPCAHNLFFVMVQNPPGPFITV